MIPTHLTLVIILTDFTFFTDFYKILAFSEAFFSQNMQLPTLFSIDPSSQSLGLPHEYSGLSQKWEGVKKVNLNFHLKFKDIMTHSNRCYGKKIQLGSK